jgi:NAD(P)-dependent dehydrogenase (short-subunit alcohol dehydrogenase family)
MDVKGRIVLITGASAGIGLATAKLLARQGAKVALAARSRDKLEAVARELPGSLPVTADISRRKDIVAMVKAVHTHFGRIDILINNAGRGYDAPVEKTNVETLRGIFDLDFIGPLVAMQEVIPIMRPQGGGLIVNVSSGTALMTLPNMGGYSALKRALAHLSLTAREELAKDHIGVTVVYPYITLTDFEENTIKDFVGEEPEEAEGQPGQEGEGGYQPPPPDPAEFVAQRILEGISSEAAEIFAHDWMKR